MARIHYLNVCAFVGRTGRPFLTDFTVEDGVFIGGDDPAPNGTEIRSVDMRGAFVMPAFLDVHAHPEGLAMTLRATACTPPAVKSIEDMIRELRASSAAQKGEGWIEGWGYDESLLDEKRSPTREDLDRVSTTQPVFIRRSDYHSAVVNTRALELAGITRDTPDPERGAFGRDAEGNPDGRLIELGAVEFVEHHAKPAKTFESDVETLLLLKDHYLSHGILTTCDMMCDRGGAGHPEPLALYREAARRGLPVEMNLYAVWKGGEDPFGMPDFTEDEKTGAVRYAGVKLFADGSISGRTAAVRNPYVPPEGGAPNEYPSGMMILEEKTFRAAVAFARRNDVQCAVHIMGDRSIDAVLGWLETETPWLEGVPSVRLEHVSMLRDDQLEKIERMALKPALTTQIIFPFAEWRSYRAALTPEDFDACYRVKSIAKKIDAFALSSDAPCTTWGDTDDVMACLEAAVTRRDSDGGVFNPNEAVSIGTALSLYTSRAAKVMPVAGRIGVIEPGARANFITLSANPFMAAPSKLHQMRVTGVWKDGEKIYLKPRMM
ncbi:amidohydrolase [Sutterella sp.]|uniref:amidohydrolase n=1 Tax=Sutterella sp. TaxID=1981025 RepID=UPI003FD74267